MAILSPFLIRKMQCSGTYSRLLRMLPLVDVMTTSSPMLSGLALCSLGWVKCSRSYLMLLALKTALRP